MTRGGKKLLFFSGSVGLGHVTRDLVIAEALRRRIPEIEIHWLAAPPASQVIRDAGEPLVPEADLCTNASAAMEQIAGAADQVNLIEYVTRVRAGWKANVDAFLEAMARERFDLVIGDETYEISMAVQSKPALKTAPYVMIYDFIGLDAMTRSLKERLVVWILNKKWSADYNARKPVHDLTLFVGQIEDVPDRPFGFLLPNRRAYVSKRCRCLGYILPFRPIDYANREEVRAKLGYGDEPLVVCSVGGTAVGKDLLEKCAQAYPLVRRSLPELRMILVAGPRIRAETIRAPEGVEITGYLPSLHEHFAASDLSVVQGSGTTTLELTALKRPFLYFPIAGHYEQEVLVSERLERHRAGIRMNLADTTPGLLAEKIESCLGRDVDYSPIPTDGAERAAELIATLL
jgi:predicted glycosyltransferase